jgi:murein DD-endopeptidase MepM/ murein hydrolase activator NlpD
MRRPDNRSLIARASRPLGALAAATAAAGTLALAAGGAPAHDLHSKLDQKKAQLAHARQREGVLSTTIQRYGDRIDELRGQVATLRNREVLVQAQLNRVEAELKRDEARLEVLRVRLKRSLRVLRQRLIAIYETDQPDALTVILNANGFDDLMNRYEYLQHIQGQDTSIAERVRNLRNAMKDTVLRVRDERAQIAAKKAELEQTQAQLEARQSDLTSAREHDRATLDRVQHSEQELEGDVSDIQAEIQAQLQAAQAAQAAQASTPAPPAGPVQGESSSGFIWPVNGPVTSPFCEPRPWESCHPGIDISVPSGTPIHAAATGTVAIAGPESGYGNYTCIDHGGGISSCYGHQASISVSVGQRVSQGQVIGISDCTGLCFGPHLHFEIRQNGTPVDPMAYLP